MIYVDAIQVYSPEQIAAGAIHAGRKWCHMWCDDGEEEQLHAMAFQIDLQRGWFQGHGKLKHYDLVPSKRKLAIQCGAVEMPLRVWLRRQREKEKNGTQTTNQHE